MKHISGLMWCGRKRIGRGTTVDLRQDYRVVSLTMLDGYIEIQLDSLTALTVSQVQRENIMRRWFYKLA